MESEYYPCLALYTKSPFINTPQPVFFQVYSPKLTKKGNFKCDTKLQLLYSLTIILT